MDREKLLPAIRLFIIAWSGFVIAAYFVAHKPLALQVIDHLGSLIWTLAVTFTLLLNALALGKLTIKRFVTDVTEDASLLALAGGIGLGELGLLGFVLAAAGIANFLVFLTAQIFLLVLFVWKHALHEVIFLVRDVTITIKSSAAAGRWMKWAIVLAFTLTFLMTLLPPVEAYDALLYHLTVPQLWLRDGGLRPYNIPPYWFPNLAEGTFVWGLGMGTDIVPQQLHFFWAVFTALLLWDWSRKVWDDVTGWWVWMFCISMPSLLLLASWAYTDLALTFFSVATLYALWQGNDLGCTRWWRLAAIAAGMAMGVKYTSVIVLLTAVILIAFWMFRRKDSWLTQIIWFGSISGLTGCIWYLRNWFWMGNPFYPFLFGGRYWDTFRAAWYAGTGTGAGWDLKEVLSLPLTITLGYQDITSFDGNIGPLFLLSLPMAIWIIMGRNRSTLPQRQTLRVIGWFVALSVLFWTWGYVTSKNLWQARLLLPAIIPSVIPASLGVLSIRNLDSKRLHLSFIVSGLVMVVVFINLLDLGLKVVYRNPFATAVGSVSRESFTEKFQPGYAAMLQLVDQTPKNSKIYSLFEPRSYGVPRNIQPDTLLDNFPHDVFLYKNPEDIVHAWQAEGYTYVLVSKRGANLVVGDTTNLDILNETLSLLRPVSELSDEDYSIYEITGPG